MIRTRRSGFTLLEILLTLSIASILIGAVAAAVQIHLRVVESGRAEVEQAQLARALLHRIADDLRAAVPLENDDLATSDAASAAVDTTSATSGAASSSGASVSSGSASSSIGSAAASQLAETATDASTSSDDAETSSFFGSRYELQFDAARMPDVRRYSAMTTDAALNGAGQALDALADVTTVSYFVGAASPTGASSLDPPGPLDPATGGLIRRELPRAAATFAATQGGIDAASYERLLAAEAVTVQFAYFDGSQWWMEWDALTTGTLPACVEILLTLRSGGSGITADSLSPLAAANQPLERTYRLVVPLANVASAASTGSMETAAAETSP